MESFTLIILLFGLHYGNTLSNMQEIPEAPRLPDLDYNSLPEFIRKYLPTEKPTSKIQLNQAKEKTAPKTYGMKLNNGDGVVWNDLLPARMSYYVGDKNTARNSGKDIDDIIDEMLNKIDNHTPKPEDTTKVNEITTSAYEKTTPKIVIFRTTETPKTTAKPEKEASEKELLNEIESKLDIIMKNVSKLVKLPYEAGKDKIEDRPSDDTKGDKGTSQDNKSVSGKDVAKSKIMGKPARDEQKPDLPYVLELLIQNDELWQWLSDTIAKYLEILIGRIGGVVQEEVEVLMQEYFEAHDCGCKANNNSRHDANGNSHNKLDSDKKEEGKKNTTNVNEEITDSDSKNKTEGDNINSKHNKDKHPESNKGDNKTEKETSHEKTIIYGNSVGNERVTNVFIFHVSSDVEPSVSTNNSSGSHTINFDKNPLNKDDKNKPNQDNSETGTVTTESTKNSNDTTENDKVTTESAIETEKDMVSKDTEVTSEMTQEIDENDSKETTTEAITTEKEVDSEEGKNSTEVTEEETTIENDTTVTPAEEAEE